MLRTLQPCGMRVRRACASGASGFASRQRAARQREAGWGVPRRAWAHNSLIAGASVVWPACYLGRR